MPFILNFTYTGTIQSFTVPAGITKLRITARGAGGTTVGTITGGKGAIMSSIVPVTPLETLYVHAGGTSTNNIASLIGGGGSGGTSANTLLNAGAGGGFSGVFRNAIPTQSSALIVAGGGGGATRKSSNTVGGNAGIVHPGNGVTGGDFSGSFGINAGGGGTLTAGGAAGNIIDTQSVTPTAGSVLLGGRGGSTTNSAFVAGGGGGGGYYGGGGAVAGGDATGGGGGGSSYSIGEALFVSPANPADTNGSVLVEAIAEISPVSFTYTGDIQTWTVPQNVQSIKITAVGANGGFSVRKYANGEPIASGGVGGIISSIIPVTANSTLNIVVGGSPYDSTTATYGYGGNGGVQGNATRSGAAGGGLSGIFTGTPSIANALIIAGGGGGAGSYSSSAFGGNAPTITPGDGSNGGAADPTDFPGTYGRGGKTSTQTPGARGDNLDTQVSGQGPTAGTTIQGGRGGSGVRFSTDFGGGGAGGGAYAGGGGSGGGAASGGGGAGSSYSVTANVNKTEFGTTANTVYNFTGSLQTYVVPNDVLQLRVTAVGACGGAINSTDIPGFGSNITSVINVTPGSTLYLYVGRCPGNYYFTYQLTGLGFGSSPGAGVGGLGGTYYDTTSGIPVFGGGGGGFSGIFTSNVLTQANALIVSGGGGGASSPGSAYAGGNGGIGSFGSGVNGKGGIGPGFGRGATTSVGGVGGTGGGDAGTVLYGGTGGSRSVSVSGTTGYGGGGGGAGWYGGGGGTAGGAFNVQGGGGGGSSWSSNATITYNTILNDNLNHGKIYISPVYSYGNGSIKIEQIT